MALTVPQIGVVNNRTLAAKKPPQPTWTVGMMGDIPTVPDINYGATDPFGTGNNSADPGLPPTMHGGILPGAPPSVPGVSGGHWSTPDWASLIAGDPAYSGTLIKNAADLDTAQRNRAAAIRSAIVNSGYDPSAKWNPDLYGDNPLNAADLLAANTNPFSTRAATDLQHNQGTSDLREILASRGMLSSGALTGGTNELQRGYEQAGYTNAQTLLGLLGGYQGAYTDTAQGIYDRGLAALTEASGRVQAGNPVSWLADPTPGVGEGAVGPVVGLDPATNMPIQHATNTEIPYVPPPIGPPPVKTAAQLAAERLAAGRLQRAGGY